MRRHNTKDTKDSCRDLKQQKRHQHALMNSIKKKRASDSNKVHRNNINASFLI